MVEQRSAFRDVMVACRPQRVAISFDASDDWRTRAAVALATMGKVWGGLGFILIPHTNREIHPALLRIARLYDPDYVNEFNYTDEDFQPAGVEDVTMVDEEGVEGKVLIVSRRVPRIVVRPPEALLDATSVYRTEILEDRSPHGVGWMRSDALNSMTPIAKMHGLPRINGVYLAVPPQVGGAIGLAMAMRCGFVAPPVAPFETDPAFDLSEDDVGYSMGLRHPTMAMLQATGSLAIASRIPIDTEVAWVTTLPGLTNISFVPSMLRPSIVVVGSSAEDFCLALALMRMTAFVLWLPVDVVSAFPDKVDSAIFNFFNDTDRRHGQLRVTSISLNEQEIEGLLGKRFRACFVDAFTRVEISYLGPEDIPIPYQTDILGCTPEFDDQLTLPTLDDKNGGIDLAQSIPYKIPECAKYAPENRPFWEVDVTIFSATTPVGRNSSHLTSADDSRTRGYANIRSSQAGLSFNALSDGWTDASQPIRQSIARPKLRYPSLLEWIQARCDVSAEFRSAYPSDAGRRAIISAGLFGGRPELATGLQIYGKLFREFLPPIATKTKKYADGDGFFIKDLAAAVLSFRAAIRVLIPGTPEEQSAKADEIRRQMDSLLSASILRRGLVLRCNACRRISFFAVDSVQQSNRCPRCGNLTVLSKSAWITRQSEPEWFYDLQASVAGLVEQNGDVPVLAGQYLAGLARGRPFIDAPELNFYSSRKNPDEIDVITHAENTVIVAEAKSVNHLKGTVSLRESAARKLVRVSHLLHADQIALISSDPEPWEQTSVDALVAQVEKATWPYGPPPKIRLVSGIGTETVTDTQVDRQPWIGGRR